MHIIDRRLNSGQKSLENRQRFTRRTKTLVQKAVREASGKGSIQDIVKGGAVDIPVDGIAEPRLSREGGIRDRVLPGNKKFAEGDILDRSSGGKGKQSEASEGDSEDTFRFLLSHDEFVDLFLDDCELPDLAKKGILGIDQTKPRRAGYTMSGAPTAMAIPKTVMRSIARRIALRGAIKKKIEGLETELLECADEERKLIIAQELEKCRERLGRIAFIDPFDIRYRRFEQMPVPVAQAVMFCLMDVSGSMTEHMKDLAKRFYMLLYVFLKRRYKRVEVVFIRHTDKAEEVDEDTFFHGPASGGTLVSSALVAMREIVKERFDPAKWNIYAAQASDGDNAGSDGPAVSQLLTETILPMSQFFAYLEVGESTSHLYGASDSSLWTLYQQLRARGAPVSIRKVSDRGQIFPVFHELFEKKGSTHAAVG